MRSEKEQKIRAKMLKHWANGKMKKADKQVGKLFKLLFKENKNGNTD